MSTVETPAPPAEKLVKAEALAEVLGVHVSTVRDWARGGRIPSVRLSPAALRFRVSDVMAALAKP